MQLGLVSVVAPVFKNATTLIELHEQVSAAIAKTGARSEIVFVNDASPDESSLILAGIAEKDSSVRVITNSSNIGQQGSIRRGLAECRGDVVVVMDADLQDPPGAIPVLVERLQKGDVDAVFATRTLPYQSRFRMLCSHGYKAMIRRLTGLPKGAAGYVAIEAELARKLTETGNSRFYLAGLIGCRSQAIGTVPVEREFRRSGQSAYTERMRFATAFSNILCVLRERGWHGAS